MRLFTQREIVEAVQHSTGGGQSLHLHQIIVDKRKAPKCFVTAINNGENIAHLFDMDESRLVNTVRKLGVRKILVERRGTDKQHVDLCGAPLKKAVEMCHRENITYEFT